MWTATVGVVASCRRSAAPRRPSSRRGSYRTARLSRWQDDNDLVDILGRMLERLLDLHGALRRLYGLNGDVPEHEVG